MKRSPLGVTLLRLGQRCARGAGADGVVHWLAVVLAAATAVVTAWVFVACVTVYDRRGERVSARSPVFVSDAHSKAAIALWLVKTDTANQRQFSVISLMPLVDGATPPPGLTRWPAPGEAFLSPRLLADDGTGELRVRYGAAGGTIGRDGLADPNEYLVYFRPIEFSLDGIAPNQGSIAIKSFGARRPFPLVNQVFDTPLSAALEMLIVLALPTIALLIVAARTGARRRDTRLAILDALGAPLRARMFVLLGEAIAPAATGVAIGIAVVWLTTIFDVRLPFSGYVIRSDDLATARPNLGWLGPAILMAVLAAIVALHLRRPAGVTNRPTGTVAPARDWPGVLFVLALVVAAAGAIVRGNPGRFAYGAGMLMALATLPMVAARLASALGKAVASWGNSRGAPSAIVGGRWLAVRPAVIARTGAVFVISLGLATQAQVMQTQLTSIGQTSGWLRRTVGTSMVELHASTLYPAAMARFSSSLDQRRLLSFYYEELPPERVGSSWSFPARTTVVGSPEVLATLGKLKRPPVTPVSVPEAYTDLSGTWSHLLQLGVLKTGAVLPSDTMKYADRLFVSTTPPRDGKYQTAIVLNSEGTAGVQQIKRSTFVALGAPTARVAADDFQAAAADYAELVNWMLDLGLLVMIILIFTGGVATAGVFVAQSQELGSLAGFQASRRLYFGIAGWNLVFPLAVVSVLGAATAAALGGLLTRLAPSGELSGHFLGLCLGLAVLGSVVVGFGCGEAATRGARRWRPSGD